MPKTDSFDQLRWTKTIKEANHSEKQKSAPGAERMKTRANRKVMIVLVSFSDWLKMSRKLLNHISVERISVSLFKARGSYFSCVNCSANFGYFDDTRINLWSISNHFVFFAG